MSTEKWFTCKSSRLSFPKHKEFPDGVLTLCFLDRHGEFHYQFSLQKGKKKENTAITTYLKRGSRFSITKPKLGFLLYSLIRFESM